MTTRTTESANSRRGRTGSDASRCRHTNSAPSATTPNASTAIAGDVHDRSTPPVLVSTTRHASAPVSNAAPA
jgi:hypothetical protein